MKTSLKSQTIRAWCLFFSVALSLSAFLAFAGSTPLQIITRPDLSMTPPDSAAGDSGTPIISADGRYLIFVSTANNLWVTSDNVLNSCSQKPNVFLRDRTAGTTTLVSVSTNGMAGGNGDSLPVNISADGRYAAFESLASDLIANDTNEACDIFVRDLVNDTMTLVSVSTNGEAANGASRSTAMTPDGRYVAFVSAASNLVVNDTNGIPDVFVRDVQNGTTRLASVGATLANSSSSSEAPDITPDGRYVAFYSTATNLVSGITNTGDIYIRDLAGEVTTWASSGARSAVLEAQGVNQAVSYSHVLSADGQFVAYETSHGNFSSLSRAGIILRYSRETGLTDLVSTNAYIGGGNLEEMRTLDMTPNGRFIAFAGNVVATSRTTCINVWDANANTVTLASCDTSGAQPANSFCEGPTLDPSGQYVAFLAEAPNLVTNSTVSGSHLYVRNMLTGITSLIDTDTNGVGSLTPFAHSRLSTNGSILAFCCIDGGLIANDDNGFTDVFVRDMTTNTVELVSVRHPALPSLSPNGSSAISDASISADGRFVAFSTMANNLVANDTNGCRDIFVCDLQGGTNVLVSVKPDGACANGSSADPMISADGRYVAFSSWATNLVNGDTEKRQDVFVRDLQARTTTRVNVNTGITSYVSAAPIGISPGGRYVLFSINRTSQDIYFLVRDLVTSNTYQLDASYNIASMSSDGRFVALGHTYSPRFALWDAQSNSIVYTDTTWSAKSYAVSPDGNRIALSTGSTLWLVDRAANTQQTIASGLTNAAPLKLSPDGRFLVYKATQETSQLFLYDMQSQTSRRISQSASGEPGNGWSGDPSFGLGGRFIAYRSRATNLAPNATNGAANVFLYDQQTGTSALISAGGPCFNPIFSGDGRTLVFSSYAADLEGQDFNRSSDIFAFTFLIADLCREGFPGRGNRLNWLMVPGKTARVQFKDSLNDLNWHDLPGSVTVQGNRGSILDSEASSNLRFYRIVAE